MASGILSISLTGLSAAQAGIRTTQHNIANVNTEGYRRQEVNYATNPSHFTSAGWYGTGVAVESVRRLYSQFLDNEVLHDQAQLSRHEAYTAQASQIDRLLGDAGSGLHTALDNYFSAANEVANDPTSNAARQNLLTAGRNLAGRINTLDSKLRDMRASGNADIVAVTQQVNVLAGQVATLNSTIARDEAANGRPANDLRDQRDQVIAELNKLLNVTQLHQPDGRINLYIAGGQPLVLDNRANTMTTVSDPADPTQRLPALDVGGNIVTLTAPSVTGGQLGGILAQREQVLNPAMNDLNRIAIALSLEMNAIHRNGLDYNLNQGTDFFTPSVTQQAGTSGWLRLGESTSGTPIPPKNYTASWNGTQFTVSDGTFSGSFNPGDEVVLNGVAQGFSLLPNPGQPAASFAPVAGDAWNLNFSDFAKNIRTQVTAASQIAAAGVGATGPGDNSNMLALAGLRIAKLLNNGTVSLSQAYDQSVTRTASLAADADLSRTAYTSLVEQATASRQGVSGVNLDEEAANLIRFQQAYQASARALQIATGLFDELLGIVR